MNALTDLDYLLIDYLCDLPASLRRICSESAAETFNRPYHNLRKAELLKRLAKLEGSDFLNISSEYVCLTAKGGAAWEERFKPEWSKYIRVEVFYRCKCEFARIGCLDFSNLESFVGGVSGSAISFSKIKRVSGWAPRYWKRFEFGYQMLAVVADAQVLDEYCLYAQSSWRLCWKTMDFSDGLTK